MKNVLLISPEPWGHIPVSKHHYARKLAERGHHVTYLNPPSSRHCVKETNLPNLQVVDYKGFQKGLRFLPSWFRNQNIRHVFHTIENLAQVEFDTIWSFDTSVFIDFRALPTHVYKILHIVDLNQVRNVRRLGTDADLCICTSEFIANHLHKYNSNVHKVNHGFAAQAPSTRVFESSFPANVGYGGNLDIKYLSWPTIIKQVVAHPNIGFYFAGSCSSFEVRDLFEQHANMQLVGVLTPGDLYAFYQQMDALLICYDVDQYKEQLANPHKLLEYLASGRPTIATYTAEYADLSKEILPMSSTTSSWGSIFEEVMGELGRFDTESLVEIRRKIAHSNTYDIHLKRILELAK